MSDVRGGNGVPPEHDDELDEAAPSLQLRRRSLVLGVVFVLAIVAFLYFVLPRIAGLEDTWHRIEEGDPWWLALAVGFTVASFGGYVVLFQRIYVGGGMRKLTIAESYEITMAGLAATRLFAAGGAGGIALTAWALRRAGMEKREVADRSVAFLVLTHAVYMVALAVFALGLRWGIFPGPDVWAMTVLPAMFALTAIGVTLLLALTPTDLAARLEGWADRGGRLAHVAQRAANLPAALSAGVRLALGELRHGGWSLLGAVIFWGAQIGTLWAAFHAFGQSPPLAVLVVGFFVGMLGNLLPLPGGVGGVDGGMIGALAALGVDFGAAAVAVLTYRGISYWLPTIPGAIAYFQLRRTVSRWTEERRRARVLSSEVSHAPA
jgi:uncharacterized protein (TIRG00374 family)